MRVDLVGGRGQIPVSTSRDATLSASSAVSMVLLVMVAASTTRPAPMATCEFRFNPAGDSDLIPATIPI